MLLKHTYTFSPLKISVFLNMDGVIFMTFLLGYCYVMILVVEPSWVKIVLNVAHELNQFDSPRLTLNGTAAMFIVELNIFFSPPEAKMMSSSCFDRPMTQKNIQLSILNDGEKHHLHPQ